MADDVLQRAACWGDGVVTSGTSSAARVRSSTLGGSPARLLDRKTSALSDLDTLPSTGSPTATNAADTGALRIRFFPHLHSALDWTESQLQWELGGLVSPLARTEDGNTRRPRHILLGSWTDAELPLTELIDRCLPPSRLQLPKNGVFEDFFELIVDIPPGTVLWRKGTPAETMYIVHTGVLGIPGAELDGCIQAHQHPSRSTVPCWDTPCSVKTNSPSPDASRRHRHPLYHRRRVVVDHPVWDTTVVVHSAAFLEHVNAGQPIGEVEFFSESHHPTSLVVVDRATVWKLTKAGLRRMEDTNPSLLCILQQIALRCNSMRLSLHLAVVP